MSRFAKYKTEDDRPPLRKLEAGESFTAKLIGDHDYDGDDGPVPVLELKDENGREFAWIAGAWHAATCSRMPTRNVATWSRSRASPTRAAVTSTSSTSYKRRSGANGDVPIDTSGLTEGEDDEPLPF